MFLDGRRFYCKFFRAIDGEASRVQLIKMRIYLKVKKCRPDEAWLSYRVCLGSLNGDRTKHGYRTGYVLGSVN